MAKKKLTDLEQLGSALSQDDVIHVVDVSDTDQDSAGSSKKLTFAQIVEFFNGELELEASQISDFDTEVSNNADVSANTTNRHSHVNKSLLDTYTQTEADLSDAVSKKHTQNTDTALDQGGANEVTASEIISHFADITNPHNVTKSQVGLGNVLNVEQIPATEKGVANGVASLDSNGKIVTSQIPALALTEAFTVADQTEMLALDAQQGDIAIRSDLNKTFILADSDPSVLGNWVELATPTDAVLSVNGQTGVVSLDTGDISENGNLYFTNQRAIDAVVKEFAFDPTADDDDSNTGGNGTFAVGEFWLNTLDGGLFQVHDITTGSADWREVVKLNADGELVGVFIPRHDTQAVIDGIVLEDGEIAFTTDRHEVRLGNGVDAGGIQAECHYTAGEELTLSGTVSNPVTTADASGTTVEEFGAFNILLKNRITPYKIVDGIKYFYDSIETPDENHTETNDYLDIITTWDSLPGADGYILEFHCEIVGIFALTEYSDGYYDVGNVTSYSWVSYSPQSDQVGFINSALDNSNQTYNDVALETAGAINLTNGGVRIDNVPVLFKTSAGGLILGTGDTFDSESFGVGTNNILKNNGFALGLNQEVDGGSGSAIGLGQDNFIKNVNGLIAVGIGRNLDVNGVAIGQNISTRHKSEFWYEFTCIGNNLYPVTRGLHLGQMGTLDQLPSKFIIDDDNQRIGYFTDTPTFDGVEFNRSVLIEDAESVGSELLNNPNCDANWNFTSSECEYGSFGVRKYAEGNDVITPPNTPTLTAGKRYRLRVSVLDINGELIGGNLFSQIDNAFKIDCGGVEVAKISSSGYYTFVFTAQNSNVLTFTPKNPSRFELNYVSLQEVTGGDLDTLGDIRVGNNVNNPDHEIKNDGSAHFNKNQDTDGDVIISTENVVEAFKVDSSADEVIVNTDFKVSDKFFVDESTGAVGIGTNSPEQPLHVVGAGLNLGSIRVDNTGAGATLVANRTDGVPANIHSGPASSRFIFHSGGSGGDFHITGNPTRSEVLSGTNTTITDFLTIDGVTGNVGIGTTVPSSVLTVESSDVTVATIEGTGNSTRLVINSTDATPNAGIRLQENGANTWSIATYNSGTFTFYNDPLSAEALGIDSSNNVVFNESGRAADFRIEGDTEPNLFFVDGSTDKIGIGTTSPTAKLDINSDVMRLRTAKTPASAGASGNTGDIAWDSNYMYVCVATNTWKRSPLSTW